MPDKKRESSKLPAVIEKLAKSGLKVTNTTCKGKAIGFVGGVRLPKRESVDDGQVASSEPVVN